MRQRYEEAKGLPYPHLKLGVYLAGRALECFFLVREWVREQQHPIVSLVAWKEGPLHLS